MNLNRPSPSLSQRAQSLKSSDVRELLKYANDPHMVSMAGGLPAAELFDVQGLQQASALAIEQQAVKSFQYGRTEGQADLREQLVPLLAQRGITCSTEDILVTSGSQQALDLVVRALINPGDTVAVERPTYLAALQAFSLSEPRYVCMDGDDDGACVEQLFDLPAHQRPKLVYLVSTFSNPTGATLSLARREALVRWAVKHQVVIFEDDPYGELRASGQAIKPMVAIARDIPGASDWVAYTSTLSKILAPGLRIGWLVMPPMLFEAVAKIKQAIDLHSSSFTQQVAANYLASGRLSQHLPGIKAEYGHRQGVLRQALAQTFGSSLMLRKSEGGMFLWGRFTDGTNTRALLSAAMAQGVMFVPGDAFFTDNAPVDTLRLNFTGASPQRLLQGVERLKLAKQTLLRQAA
jgi:2-aminoadipate transaminase